MKKSLLALAALTAFAGVASAQSSVTLFGTVDLALRNAKTGVNTVKSVTKNGLSSSEIGLRGSEDLGGGLRANFYIQGDMDPDTGTPGGQQWTRRSVVGLSGGFGEMRLGRDYTPSFWNYTVYDPFGTNGLGSMLNTVSTLNAGATTLVRANNAVEYFTPAMGGFALHGMVSAGENTTGNKYTGVRAGFSSGPISVHGALGSTPRTGTMTADYKDANVGASFKFGTVTLIGQYSKRDGRAASSSAGLTAGTNYDQNTTLFGATIGIGASGTLKASLAKSSGNVTTNVLDNQQVAVGYQHNMSKRTALYGTYAKLDWKGNTTALSADRDVTGFEVGVRHFF